MGPTKGLEAAKAAGFKPALGHKLKLKASAIKEQHFWRAAEPAHSDMFISDSLYKALIDRGITGFSFEACDLV